MTQLFDGLREMFRWVEQADGSFWYEFDAVEAKKIARKQRDAAAREAKKEGRRVKRFSLGAQLRSMGGIGTKYPHIEVWTTGYAVSID